MSLKIGKILKSMIQLTIIFFSQAEMINPFENILIKDFLINVNILYLVNITLKNLLFIKEFLQSSIYKYISWLISIIKWLLAENVILKLELKNVKILLNDKKTWKIGKRLILKEKIIINMNEILILFEEIKVITQNKKKKIDKLYKKSRKNIIIKFILILKEIEYHEIVFRILI